MRDSASASARLFNMLLIVCWFYFVVEWIHLFAASCGALRSYFSFINSIYLFINMVFFKFFFFHSFCFSSSSFNLRMSSVFRVECQHSLFFFFLLRVSSDFVACQRAYDVHSLINLISICFARIWIFSPRIYKTISRVSEHAHVCVWNCGHRAKVTLFCVLFVALSRTRFFAWPTMA